MSAVCVFYFLVFSAEPTRLNLKYYRFFLGRAHFQWKLPQARGKAQQRYKSYHKHPRTENFFLFICCCAQYTIQFLKRNISTYNLSFTLTFSNDPLRLFVHYAVDKDNCRGVITRANHQLDSVSARLNQGILWVENEVKTFVNSATKKSSYPERYDLHLPPPQTTPSASVHPAELPAAGPDTRGQFYTAQTKNIIALNLETQVKKWWVRTLYSSEIRKLGEHRLIQTDNQ